MAATLAMVFAMGQGNVFYPLTPFGLHWLALDRYLGGRRPVRGRHRLARHRTALIGRRGPARKRCRTREQNSQGILAVINSAGSDAIRLALGAVPMLILSLTIVRAAAGRRGYRPAAASC